MPVEYRIDVDTGLIETRCFGEMTFEEVLEHFQEVGSEERLPERMDVLLDLSAVTNVPDSGQLRDVVDGLELLERRVLWGRCAMVVSDDLMYGMFRMFEAFTDQLFRSSYVFRDREEARAWLAAGHDN